jgi:hypothetical protein
MWQEESICLQPERVDIARLAQQLYDRTCRTDHEEPGFCALNLGNELKSAAFRQIMVDLKQSMVSE